MDEQQIPTSESPFVPKNGRARPRTIAILLAAGIPLILFLAVYTYYFSAPHTGVKLTTFVVQPSVHATDTASIIHSLKEKGLIQNERGSSIALAVMHTSINPGGYELSGSMNAFQVARVFARGPSLKWAVIPEGLRKEEIAEILAKTLGWNKETQDEWIMKDTAPDPDHSEGVYFPDTYLIPIDDTPADVATRLRAKFEETFAPYAKEAAAQNIKWTTVLKLASIVEREAAGAGDMPLVAGIFWNRLLSNMRLDVDATLQYAKGSEAAGWWPPITASDKAIDSPYNTYMHSGLPPGPISNPGIEAIAAVLHPAQTKCLYYLHDHAGEIHCSVTYDEHKANIEKYLK